MPSEHEVRAGDGARTHGERALPPDVLTRLEHVSARDAEWLLRLPFEETVRLARFIPLDGKVPERFRAPELPVPPPPPPSQREGERVDATQEAERLAYLFAQPLHPEGFSIDGQAVRTEDGLHEVPISYVTPRGTGRVCATAVVDVPAGALVRTYLS